MTKESRVGPWEGIKRTVRAQAQAEARERLHDDAITCRPQKPSDSDFIQASWLKSFKDSHFAGVIPMILYWKTYTPVVRTLLADPGVEVMVAVNPYEPDPEYEIYGYLVFERTNDKPIVHYCYVKEAYRRHRVASRLFLAAGIDRDKPFVYSFRTRVVASLEKTHKMRGRLDPMVVRERRLEWEACR